MGPCLCGDSACPSCNPGAAEAEARAERVSGIFAVHLGRIRTIGELEITTAYGRQQVIPGGSPLAKLLDAVTVRTGPIPGEVTDDPPPPLGSYTEGPASEALDGVVLELGIELETEAYGEGYEASRSDAAEAATVAAELGGLSDAELEAAVAQVGRVQASGAWPWRVPATPEDLENAPADPIAELLAHLAERARLIPRGSAFHGGPLDGASRYNVALAGIREIVAWDHQRKGPVGADCTACGELRACSPQGATAYPLCLACYQVAVLEAAEGPRPPAVKPPDHPFTPSVDQGGDPDPTVCDLCGQGREGHPEDEDLEIPLWAIYTEDGDLDGYVRGKDHAEALAAAAETGIDGDYTVELAGDEPAPPRPALVDAAGVPTVAGAEAMFAAQDSAAPLWPRTWSAEDLAARRAQAPSFAPELPTELVDHLARQGHGDLVERRPFTFPNLPELRMVVAPEVPGGVALVTERAALEAWARECTPPPGSLGVLVFHDREGNPVAEAEITRMSVRLEPEPLGLARDPEFIRAGIAANVSLAETTKDPQEAAAALGRAADLRATLQELEATDPDPYEDHPDPPGGFDPSTPDGWDDSTGKE